MRSQCVILYYHSIPKENIETFAKQMDLFVSMVQPISRIEDTEKNPNGQFGMITFDDGYESAINNGLPQLRLRNIPCTIFITTGSLGSKPDWISDSNHPFYNERVIDHQQIMKIALESNVLIGSHGVSHKNSCRISDEEFMNEIDESKLILEKISNRNVSLFSFPHGKYSKRHLKMLQSSGYERVFSIEPTVEHPCSKDFLLGRISVSPDEWMVEYFLKLKGCYRWLPHIYLIKRKIINFLNFHSAK